MLIQTESSGENKTLGAWMAAGEMKIGVRYKAAEVANKCKTGWWGGWRGARLLQLCQLLQRYHSPTSLPHWHFNRVFFFLNLTQSSVSHHSTAASVIVAIRSEPGVTGNSSDELWLGQSVGWESPHGC